jgi:endonuclease/exonuclease/phosphatase (EEP) superfamily protein YafD
MVLAGMALSMLVASALADVFDQFRHELVAFALFDMLLAVLLWVVAAACATIKTSQPQTGKTTSAS